MRVMSRVFRLHQNFATDRCRRSAIPVSHPSSLRLVNNTSSRKRPTTLRSHKLYTQCFTSRHHVITNKIHDITTLCASCHECFDCIKTLLHIMSSILRSLHPIASSLRLASHRYRHASVMQLYTSSQNFTRVSIVDRFDFFWVTKIVTSFLKPCAPLATRIAKS